ncbi:MAG TPA: hypothetical protein VG759_09655 [Candidatus Angelobacter sp.]|nr:hypothetical protein [Candidatus Angelobacter sp.]
MRASHTLTSGELNEVIYLLVGEIKGFSDRHNRWIKAEAPLGPLWHTLLNSALNAP